MNERRDWEEGEGMGHGLSVGGFGIKSGQEFSKGVLDRRLSGLLGRRSIINRQIFNGCQWCSVVAAGSIASSVCNDMW